MAFQNVLSFFPIHCIRISTVNEKSVSLKASAQSLRYQRDRARENMRERHCTHSKLGYHYLIYLNTSKRHIFPCILQFNVNNGECEKKGASSAQ